MEFKTSHSAPLPGSRQARDTIQTREQMRRSLMDSSKLRRLPDVSKDTMKQIYGFSRTPTIPKKVEIIPKKVEVIESKPTKIKIIEYSVTFCTRVRKREFFYNYIFQYFNH